jgi:hypothetical protein
MGNLKENLNVFMFEAEAQLAKSFLQTKNFVINILSKNVIQVCSVLAL